MLAVCTAASHMALFALYLHFGCLIHDVPAQVDSTELKSNVLAAYVASNLGHEIPQLMAAMKLTAKAGFEVGDDE